MPDGLHGIELGVHGAVTITYDAASEAIFAAFTTPPNDTRKGLIDAVVVALKAASLWAKIDVLYLLAAADAQAAKVNWKAPGTADSTEVNAPTFTADRGFTGASTKYLDTNYNPSSFSGRVYAQNSASAFAFSVTNSSVDAGMIGNTGGTIILFPRNTSNLAQGRLNINSTTTSVASTDSIGLWGANRTTSTAQQLYKNGSSVATAAGTSAAVFNGNAQLMKSGASPVYWTGQLGCAGLGSSLTAGEHLDLYNAINPYLVGVGAA